MAPTLCWNTAVKYSNIPLHIGWRHPLPHRTISYFWGPIKKGTHYWDTFFVWCRSSESEWKYSRKTSTRLSLAKITTAYTIFDKVSNNAWVSWFWPVLWKLGEGHQTISPLLSSHGTFTFWHENSQNTILILPDESSRIYTLSPNSSMLPIVGHVSTI